MRARGDFPSASSQKSKHLHVGMRHLVEKEQTTAEDVSSGLLPRRSSRARKRKQRSSKHAGNSKMDMSDAHVKRVGKTG